MTGIIMCGGTGSGMKPADCGLPKAMMNICGRSTLSFAFDKLKAFGCQRIISVGNGVPAEYEHISDKGSFGASLAAAVRKCDDYVIVLFGDVLNGGDFGAFAEYHRKSGNNISLLICGSGKGHTLNNGILSDEEAFSHNGVFAGAFIMDKAASEYITENISDGDDVAVINRLLTSDRLKKGHYRADFFFIDINTPEDYLAANKAVLYRKYIPDVPYEAGAFSPNGALLGGGECESPAYIGRSCVIDSGVKISEGTVIGNSVYIGRDAVIDGGVVMNGAYIGEKVRVRGAVVCENARLLCGASVYEGAVVGSGASAGENTCVSAGVRVWDGRRLAAETTVSADVVYSTPAPLPAVMFDSEGKMCGECGGTMDPSFAARLGSAAKWCGRTVCIGCRSTASARALMLAFAAGVSAAGGDAIIAGEISEPMLTFAAGLTGADCGAYIDGGISASVRFCAADGLPIDEESRLHIEQSVERGEFCRAGYNHYGSISRFNDIYYMYKNRLSRLAAADISGIFADVSSADSSIYKVCSEVLRERGAVKGNGKPRIAFHISGDGRRASAYSEETGYVFHEKLVMICIMGLKAKGITKAAVSSRLPSAADGIMPLLRYEESPDYRTMTAPQRQRDDEARSIASEMHLSDDGCAVMMRVLDYLSAEGISLGEAVSRLPAYASAERFIPITGSPDLLQRLASVEKPVPGRVTIRPVRTGAGLMMYVESYAAEAAAELCDFCENFLKYGFR